MLKTILAVSAAGIAGTLLRFATGTWVSTHWPRHFYAATLAVNLVGCLIIGLLYGWFLLRPEVPRSLRACMEELNLMLAGLPGENGRPAQRLAAELDARLRYTSIDEVLDEGLHTWLTDFILLVRQLGSAIHTSYLEVV